jgi:hypothetical protein
MYYIFSAEHPCAPHDPQHSYSCGSVNIVHDAEPPSAEFVLDLEQENVLLKSTNEQLEVNSLKYYTCPKQTKTRTPTQNTFLGSFLSSSLHVSTEITLAQLFHCIWTLFLKFNN